MSHPVPTITIETLFPALSKKNSDVVALIKIAHPACTAYSFYAIIDACPIPSILPNSTNTCSKQTWARSRTTGNGSALQ